MSSSFEYGIRNVKLPRSRHAFRKTHNIADTRMNGGICKPMNLLGYIPSISFSPPLGTFRLLCLELRNRSGYHSGGVANDKIPFWGLKAERR